MVADTVAFFVGHGRRVFLDCEHFFDGYAARPRLRRAGAARPRSAPAPRSASCATPTAACCRWASAGSSPTCARRVDGPAGHPLPGRHRLRGGQLPGRRRGRRHPRAGHGERLRRARRQRRHVLADRQPGDQDGPAGRAGRVPARAAAGQPRHRRAGQHRPRRPPALRRRLGVRAQGGPARQRDQGEPRAVQPPRPGRRRQRHAHPGHRDGRPGLDRAQGPRARRGPRRAGRRDRPRGRPGEGAGGRRLVVRGGRRLVRAAAARRAARTPPTPLFELESYRTSVEHWGNGVVVSEATVKVHVDGERIISTAEGNGPVNALDNALRQALVSRYPQLAEVSRWPTTRCASSAGRAARARPRGC